MNKFFLSMAVLNRLSAINLVPTATLGNTVSMTKEQLEKSSFSDVLPLVDGWRVRVINPSTNVYIPIYRGVGESDTFFMADDLNKVDPRLSRLFDHLWATTPDDRIDTEEVLVALEGWKCDYLALPSRFLSRSYIPETLPPAVHILRIKGMSANDDGLVWLMAQFMVPAYLPGGGSYDTIDVTDNMFIPEAWIAEHCPNWQQRWETAQALDLEPAMLAKFVLGPAPTALGCIPGNIELDDMMDAEKPGDLAGLPTAT